MYFLKFSLPLRLQVLLYVFAHNFIHTIKGQFLEYRKWLINLCFKNVEQINHEWLIGKVNLKGLFLK